jgi:hypothetical protein
VSSKKGALEPGLGSAPGTGPRELHFFLANALQIEHYDGHGTGDRQAPAPARAWRAGTRPESETATFRRASKAEGQRTERARPFDQHGAGLETIRERHSAPRKPEKYKGLGRFSDSF